MPLTVSHDIHSLHGPHPMQLQQFASIWLCSETCRLQDLSTPRRQLSDAAASNAGALKKAAESARGDGSRVGCSIVETFSKSAKPRELEEVLRLEYRSKLLNPKWAQAMAGEIADRAPVKWHVEHLQLQQSTTRCSLSKGAPQSQALFLWAGRFAPIAG